MSDFPERHEDTEQLSAWIRRNPEVWHYADRTPPAEMNDASIEDSIRSIVSGEHDSRHRRRRAVRKRRLILAGACTAIVAIGGAVGVAALVKSSQPKAPEVGVNCRAAAELDADAINLAPGVDPVAGCAQLWTDGKFGQPAIAPPLVACVDPRGAISVFPGEPTTCQILGLSPADTALSAENQAVVTMQDNLVSEINAVDCMDGAQAVKVANRILADSGLQGWHVEARRGAEASSCTKAGVESETKTVFVNPFP